MAPQRVKSSVCFVAKCSNNVAKLYKWEKTVCDRHYVQYESQLCSCEPPYSLCRFPTDPVLRQKWIEQINRRDLSFKAEAESQKKAVLLRPRPHEMVCSQHFKPGCSELPTENLNYPPSIEMERMLFYNPDRVPDISILTTDEEKPLTGKRLHGDCNAQDKAAHIQNPEPIIKKSRKDISAGPRMQPLKPRGLQLERIIDSDSEASGTPNNRSPSLPKLFSPFLKCSPSVGTSSGSESISVPDMTPADKLAGKLRGSKPELIAENARLRSRLRIAIQKLEKLKKKFKSYKKKRSTPTHLLDTDEKVHFYTGFPNYETLHGFFEVIKPRAQKICYWKSKKKSTPVPKRSYKKTPKKPGPQKKISLMDEFVMCLMRIRLGLLEEDLADRFSISQSHASRLLITWTKFLANECQTLIFKPAKSACMDSLPQSFRTQELKKVNHIIDGAEIFVESSGDLNVQNILWSEYKHHHTLKFLIDIQPNGFIPFISKAFPGRISDKRSCQVSGFYDVLEPKDEILADKGFLIKDEVEARYCKLTIPQGRRGVTQFLKDGVHQISQVARSRVHVERAIRRMKTFRILKTEIPLTMVPQMSNILTIIAAITNLLPPLIKDKTDKTTTSDADADGGVKVD